MKTFGVIHILLLLLLLLAFQCTHGQDYILTNRGDTLKGEVRPLRIGLDEKVRLTTDDGKKQVYSLLQVRQFTSKGEIYQPVRFDKGYTFMKLLKSGYLSLYAFQPEGQMSYDGLFLLKKDGGHLEMPNIGFKKMLSGFLNDCGDVSEKIKSGEYGKKQMDAIIDEYNTCIEQRSTGSTTTTAKSNSIPPSQHTAWNSLEEKVRAKDNLAEKTNVLDMIAEIKGKLGRGEKVPNFMIEGLKGSLNNTELKTDLDVALQTLESPQ